jgi:hypothetical protein
MAKTVVSSPFGWFLDPTIFPPQGWTDMRILVYTALAAITSPLLAQVAFTPVVVQQPSWVSSPDGSAIAVHINRPVGQAGPILHKSFSAIEVRHSQQVLSDGAHVDHTYTSRFYRDAQGRMRVEGSSVAVIFDPTIDSTYTLHLGEKTYELYPAGGGKNSTTIAAYGNSNHIDSPGVTGPVQTVKVGQIPYGSEPVAHVDTEQLGTKTINGLSCKGTRVTMTIPAHAVGNDRDIRVVNERWYSDDLMVLVKSTNDDPRFGTSSYELTDVNRNDPDPKLFKLPIGFTKSSGR